ncbi:hypothetical protein LK07_01240 [Streptomyces pluripotens]|uniref:Integral membrane protein n=1 Tax=Streptomyces pluripotens TaxID=1355015 RepID=A0A221NSW2_9ACTN|nr:MULTISPECIES: hypothetical protein [Streptomyces]ARP68618.1 hypothetical protein LK06_000160 [Streptomyces pluripotens]ASN22878.1 hypothetical protein LK07_01240 [Streptomyces pluripotens]KIE23868.1 membrane protein [Streptomyces sp. MUSC 125]MCH0558282.1 hypothetical protein [Streptomyces sp. MUM 16J]
MSAHRRLWRLRSNSLRRREDVMEAWIVLAVWVLIVVGGAVAGVVTARAAAAVFTHQRAEQHAVQAVLVAGVPLAPTVWSADGRVRAEVRWLAPDGTAHTGRTLVDSGLKAGSRVTVWVDGQGQLMLTKPAGPAEGALEAGLLGLGAALAFAAPVYGAGALARAWLDRRRSADWEREWELVGPRWTHRTS